VSKPEFFWRPPDGAPIIGVTTYRGVVVIATGSGVYTIGEVPGPDPHWNIQRISLAVRRNEEPDGD